MARPWMDTLDLLKRYFRGAPGLIRDASGVDLVKKLHDRGELRVSINRGRAVGVLRIGNERVELSFLDREGEESRVVELERGAEEGPVIGIFSPSRPDLKEMVGGGEGGRPFIVLDVTFVDGQRGDGPQEAA